MVVEDGQLDVVHTESIKGVGQLGPLPHVTQIHDGGDAECSEVGTRLVCELGESVGAVDLAMWRRSYLPPRWEILRCRGN